MVSMPQITWLVTLLHSLTINNELVVSSSLLLWIGRYKNIWRPPDVFEKSV